MIKSLRYLRGFSEKNLYREDKIFENFNRFIGIDVCLK